MMGGSLEKLMGNLKSRLLKSLRTKKVYDKIEKSESMRVEIRSRKARKLIERTLRIADSPNTRSYAFWIRLRIYILVLCIYMMLSWLLLGWFPEPLLTLSSVFFVLPSSTSYSIVAPPMLNYHGPVKQSKKEKEKKRLSDTTYYKRVSRLSKGLILLPCTSLYSLVCNRKHPQISCKSICMYVRYVRSESTIKDR